MQVLLDELVYLCRGLDDPIEPGGNKGGRKEYVSKFIALLKTLSRKIRYLLHYETQISPILPPLQYLYIALIS